jgi:hypothetical protein
MKIKNIIIHSSAEVKIFFNFCQEIKGKGPGRWRLIFRGTIQDSGQILNRRQGHGINRQPAFLSQADHFQKTNHRGSPAKHD